MKLITIKHQLNEGNRHIDGHRYCNTYELEVGWNRIKVNATEYHKLHGFTTWYPFSFYWWPPSNQWFRRRILGVHIRRKPTPGTISMPARRKVIT